MNGVPKGFALGLTAALAVAGILGGGPREVVAQEPPYPSYASPMQSVAPTRAELQQLVAPIALYPDGLVAQILAAATYPEQVVEADRWMDAHRGLRGQALADQVDGEAWDASVKALTAFPSVLGNMDRNLAWTSSLGDAYVNHEPDVMAAIQDMRQRAQAAGTLRTTPQATVTQEGQTIVVQPVNPQVVYLPQYDPWAVYGAPVVAWPGWYWYPGLFIGGPGVAFGAGFNVGFFGGFVWGWPHWGCDWHQHAVVFNHDVFVTRGPTFVNRSAFAGRRLGVVHSAPFHGNELRGGRGGFGGREVQAPRGQVGGSRWGAFSGFDHGGVARSDALRGQSSLGSVAHHRMGSMRRG